MFLVIGYGNELRRDDGVGLCVARQIAEWNTSGVRALAVHQLTPELANDIARAERVVFIDAAVGAADMRVRRIGPAGCGRTVNHVSSPQELLALSAALYGTRPAAWLIAVPVHDLGFGWGFSLEAREGMTQVLRLIRRWVARKSPVSRLSNLFRHYLASLQEVLDLLQPRTNPQHIRPFKDVSMWSPRANDQIAGPEETQDAMPEQDVRLQMHGQQRGIEDLLPLANRLAHSDLSGRNHDVGPCVEVENCHRPDGEQPR